MILCKYGCGQEGKYQLKNGEWRCSESWNSCPSLRKKNSNSRTLEERLRTSERMKRNNPMKDPIIAKKVGKSLKGRFIWCTGLTKYTDKRIKNQSEKMIGNKNSGTGYKNHSYGKFGEESYNWKGGSYNWLHSEARRLFGQDTCEVCGMTNEEHIEKTGRQLDMHCDGKRYHNMERIFWTTCCISCHMKIEALDK